MYYKVLMEGGHMGAGSSYDMCRYFKAESISAIFNLLGRLPRLKKKGLTDAVKLVEQVSEQEYRVGRHGEAMDPYLTRH